MINATSLSFILSALALSLSVALLFIWPLLKAEKRQNTSLLQLNINVFKERLQELRARLCLS
jgi:cytochrome c-type biogenesis protein CcmI